MAKVTRLPYVRPIVEEGIITQESRVILEELFNRIPITGEGSPEGVVDADVGATYYDLNAVAGSRHYIKINQDIGGDTTQGWELA